MIKVKDIVKTFDGFRALDGLSLEVPGGSIYGLVGPNGSGKSTIIRHLTGIYLQDSGEITIDGEPVFENPAVKARIAYIPDDIFYFYFYLYILVIDNFCIIIFQYGIQITIQFIKRIFIILFHYIYFHNIVI